jgi:hypothetical protein
VQVRVRVRALAQPRQRQKARARLRPKRWQKVRAWARSTRQIADLTTRSARRRACASRRGEVG